MGFFQECEEKKNICKHVPTGLLGTRFYPTPSHLHMDTHRGKYF